MALTPLLVYEAGLGVVGAALASNAARGVASALGIWQLRRDLGLRSAHLRARGEFKRILRIGAPMALGTALFAGVYWGLLKTTVSPLGAHVNAALGIGFSALEGFTWPLFHGIALASASLVGRALGAERPDLGTARAADRLTRLDRARYRRHGRVLLRRGALDRALHR